MQPKRNESGERKIVRTTIPVFHGRGSSMPGSYAAVDEDVYDTVSRYRWLWDENSASVYYEAKDADGKIVREMLHRKVMGCQKGDNSVVKFYSEDRRDCRKENLYFAPPRNLTKWHTEKYFPSRKSTFLSYLEDNHANTPVYNLVVNGSIEEYGRKHFVLHVESETASPAAMTSLLQDFFRDEFGYKGTVRVVLSQPTPKKEKKEALPAVVSAAPPTPPAVLPSTAPDMMHKVGSMFGVDYAKEATLEFCNFALRQGEDILEFSFTRKKANSLAKTPPPPVTSEQI
jgi:hypothetical protein